ncbi:hypothetical protein ACFO3U_04865 [Flavobacterium ponti]|uniref:Uncharacterized protein n=1 Tax=Flavobacterium ponti TaxID=665133 RepID=A0ABV9P146_9FLAO
MKNILKFICFLFFTINLSCGAQIVVPLKTIDEPNGAYKKDLNDIFTFWEGTWKGNINNKEYTFEFVKFTKHLITLSNGEYYYRDMLLCKFKVVDLNLNIILYDDLNITSYENYKIYNLGNIFSEYFFQYNDSDNCNNNIKFTLVKDINNPNQILYKDFSFDEYLYFDCPYANQQDIPMFLPKVDLTLTRQ